MTTYTLFRLSDRQAQKELATQRRYMQRHRAELADTRNLDALRRYIHGNLPGLTVDLPANHDNFFHAQHRPVPLSYLFILGVTLHPGVPCQHSARRIITVVCRHPALLTRVSTRFSV